MGLPLWVLLGCSQPSTKENGRLRIHKNRSKATPPITKEFIKSVLNGEVPLAIVENMREDHLKRIDDREIKKTTNQTPIPTPLLKDKAVYNAVSEAKKAVVELLHPVGPISEEDRFEKLQLVIRETTTSNIQSLDAVLSAVAINVQEAKPSPQQVIQNIIHTAMKRNNLRRQYEGDALECLADDKKEKYIDCLVGDGELTDASKILESKTQVSNLLACRGDGEDRLLIESELMDWVASTESVTINLNETAGYFVEGTKESASGTSNSLSSEKSEFDKVKFEMMSASKQLEDVGGDLQKQVKSIKKCQKFFDEHMSRVSTGTNTVLSIVPEVDDQNQESDGDDKSDKNTWGALIDSNKTRLLTNQELGGRAVDKPDPNDILTALLKKRQEELIRAIQEKESLTVKHRQAINFLKLDVAAARFEKQQASEMASQVVTGLGYTELWDATIGSAGLEKKVTDTSVFIEGIKETMATTHQEDRTQSRKLREELQRTERQKEDAVVSLRMLEKKSIEEQANFKAQIDHMYSREMGLQRVIDDRDGSLRQLSLQLKLSKSERNDAAALCEDLRKQQQVLTDELTSCKLQLEASISLEQHEAAIKSFKEERAKEVFDEQLKRATLSSQVKEVRKELQAVPKKIARIEAQCQKGIEAMQEVVRKHEDNCCELSEVIFQGVADERISLCALRDVIQEKSFSLSRQRLWNIITVRCRTLVIFLKKRSQASQLSDELQSTLTDVCNLIKKDLDKQLIVHQDESLLQMNSLEKQITELSVQKSESLQTQASLVSSIAHMHSERQQCKLLVVEVGNRLLEIHTQAVTGAFEDDISSGVGCAIAEQAGWKEEVETLNANIKTVLSTFKDKRNQLALQKADSISEYRSLLMSFNKVTSLLRPTTPSDLPDVGYQEGYECSQAHLSSGSSSFSNLNTALSVYAIELRKSKMAQQICQIEQFKVILRESDSVLFNNVIEEERLLMKRHLKCIYKRIVLMTSGNIAIRKIKLKQSLNPAYLIEKKIVDEETIRNRLLTEGYNEIARIQLSRFQNYTTMADIHLRYAISEKSDQTRLLAMRTKDHVKSILSDDVGKNRRKKSTSGIEPGTELSTPVTPRRGSVLPKSVTDDKVAKRAEDHWKLILNRKEGEVNELKTRLRHSEQEAKHSAEAITKSERKSERLERQFKELTEEFKLFKAKDKQTLQRRQSMIDQPNIEKKKSFTGVINKVQKAARIRSSTMRMSKPPLAKSDGSFIEIPDSPGPSSPVANERNISEFREYVAVSNNFLLNLPGQNLPSEQSSANEQPSPRDNTQRESISSLVADKVDIIDKVSRNSIVGFVNKHSNSGIEVGIQTDFPEEAVMKTIEVPSISVLSISPSSLSSAINNSIDVSAEPESTKSSAVIITTKCDQSVDTSDIPKEELVVSESFTFQEQVISEFEAIKAQAALLESDPFEEPFVNYQQIDTNVTTESITLKTSCDETQYVEQRPRSTSSLRQQSYTSLSEGEWVCSKCGTSSLRNKPDQQPGLPPSYTEKSLYRSTVESNIRISYANEAVQTDVCRLSKSSVFAEDYCDSNADSDNVESTQPSSIPRSDFYSKRVSNRNTSIRTQSQKTKRKTTTVSETAEVIRQQARAAEFKYELRIRKLEKELNEAYDILKRKSEDVEEMTTQIQQMQLSVETAEEIRSKRSDSASSVRSVIEVTEVTKTIRTRPSSSRGVHSYDPTKLLSQLHSHSRYLYNKMRQYLLRIISEIPGIIVEQSQHSRPPTGRTGSSASRINLPDDYSCDHISFFTSGDIKLGSGLMDALKKIDDKEEVKATDYLKDHAAWKANCILSLNENEKLKRAEAKQNATEKNIPTDVHDKRSPRFLEAFSPNPVSFPDPRGGQLYSSGDSNSDSIYRFLVQYLLKRAQHSYEINCMDPILQGVKNGFNGSSLNTLQNVTSDYTVSEFELLDKLRVNSELKTVNLLPPSRSAGITSSGRPSPRGVLAPLSMHCLFIVLFCEARFFLFFFFKKIKKQ